MLYGTPAPAGVPVSASPYVAKVEIFLKLAGLPYTLVKSMYVASTNLPLRVNSFSVDILRRPFNGPRGKLPWIVHGPNTVSDSTFIIQYLAETYGKDKARLGAVQLTQTPHDEGLHTAIQRLTEDNLANLMP